MNAHSPALLQEAEQAGFASVSRPVRTIEEQLAAEDAACDAACDCGPGGTDWQDDFIWIGSTLVDRDWAEAKGVI